MVEYIAAPDQVERSVGRRQRLNAGQFDAHPICAPGLGDIFARALDMNWRGIDSEHSAPKAVGELDRVARVAAANVDHLALSCGAESGEELIQHIRRTWVQALLAARFQLTGITPDLVIECDSVHAGAPLICDLLCILLWCSVAAVPHDPANRPYPLARATAGTD